MKVLAAATHRADDRITLCVIRSLATEGVEVTVGGDRFAGRPFFSRYTGKRLRYPHPEADVAGFFATLGHHAEQTGLDVILPTSDAVVTALAGEPEVTRKLPNVVMPPVKAWNLFRDKWETLELAGQLGIPIPKTYCCDSVEELPRLLAGLEYPLVVKPRKSSGAIGLFWLEKPSDLPEELFQGADICDSHFDFRRLLVQEYVTGDVHDVCLLFNQGEPRAVLTQKRLKMYPLKGGVGIYNETTDEPELKEQAITLLKAAGWHGPAQVEFKRKPNGQAVLMEVNGRFWGTLDLAVAAGINFPLLACQMALNGNVDPTTSYQVGLRYRWPIPYGVLHAAETGRWFRTLWDFFAPRRGVKSDISLADPLPLIAETLFTLKRRRKWTGQHSDRNSALHRMKTLTD